MAGLVGARQDAGHHWSRLADTAFQPQLDVDGFRHALRSTDQAMGSVTGQAVHGQIETASGAGIGQIYRQDYGDAERNAKNRQAQLPGMAQRMTPQRPPEQRRHGFNSRMRPLSSIRIRSARAATSRL